MEFGGVNYDDETLALSRGDADWLRENEENSANSRQDDYWVPSLGAFVVKPLPASSYWTPDLREGENLAAKGAPLVQDEKPEETDPTDSNQQSPQEPESQTEDFKTIPIQKAKKSQEGDSDSVTSSRTRSHELPTRPLPPDVNYQHPGKQWSTQTRPQLINPPFAGNGPYPIPPGPKNDFFGIPYPQPVPWPQIPQDQYIKMATDWYSQQWYQWQSLYSSFDAGLPRGPMPTPPPALALLVNEAAKREQVQPDWRKIRSFPSSQARLIGNTLKESQRTEVVETEPLPVNNKNKEALMMMFNSKKEEQDYQLNSSNVSRLAQKDRAKIDKLYKKYNIYNFSKDLRELGVNPNEEPPEVAEENSASTSSLECVEDDQRQLTALSRESPAILCRKRSSNNFNDVKAFDLPEHQRVIQAAERIIGEFKDCEITKMPLKKKHETDLDGTKKKPKKVSWDSVVRKLPVPTDASQAKRDMKFTEVKWKDAFKENTNFEQSLSTINLRKFPPKDKSYDTAFTSRFPTSRITPNYLGYGVQNLPFNTSL